MGAGHMGEDLSDGGMAWVMGRGGAEGVVKEQGGELRWVQGPRVEGGREGDEEK